MSGEARSRGGVEIPRSEPKTLQSLSGPIRYLNHVLYDATKKLAAGAIDDEIFYKRRDGFLPERKLIIILRLIRLDRPTGGGSYQSTLSDWTPIQRGASTRFSRSAWPAWQLASLAADSTEYINHHTISSK